MKGFRLLCAVAVIGLSGCVTPPPQIPPEIEAELRTPLYCQNEAECKVMWERAVFYVNLNSGYKIQTHNDSIIQTYGPPSGSRRLAWSLSKEPKEDGVYQIWTQAYCGNRTGCEPNQFRAVLDAKRYIKTGQR